MDKSTKVCTCCGEEKDLDLFSKKPSGKFGRNSQCKVCKSANYKANSVARKAAQKLYRDKPENRESARLRSQQWRKDNPERVKENNNHHSKKHYQKK